MNEVNGELKVYSFLTSDRPTGQSEKLRQYLYHGTQGYRSSVDLKKNMEKISITEVVNI